MRKAFIEGHNGLYYTEILDHEYEISYNFTTEYVQIYTSRHHKKDMVLFIPKCLQLLLGPLNEKV